MTTHLVGTDGERTLCGLEVKHLPPEDSWLYQSSATSSNCYACITVMSAPMTVTRQTVTVHEDNEGHPNPNTDNREGDRWVTMVGGGQIVDAHQERTKQLEARVAELEEQVSILTLVANSNLTTDYDVDFNNAVYAAMGEGYLPRCQPTSYKDENGCFHFKPKVITNVSTIPERPKTAWDHILIDDEPPPPKNKQLTLDFGQHGPGTRTSSSDSD